MLAARVSAEIFASTGLSQVCVWLIERQHSPMRLHADHLPALGRQTRLRVGRPITARRAVLSTLWLIEDAESRPLIAGTLRFVSHPTAVNVRLSFDGLSIHAGRGHAAARQLLELIAASVTASDASRADPMSAAG